jgi:hypothetical protein
MKIEIKSNSALIEPGIHLATIGKVYTDTASTGAEQLAVPFIADGKQITRWYNLSGYQIDTDEPTIQDAQGRTVPNYKLGKNGKRLKDQAKTESCLSILGQLCYDAGLGEPGSNADTSELEGRKVGICVVEEDSGFGSRLNVHYTMPSERVADDAEVDEVL